MPTGRPWLTGTPCADGVCTTIEYKSQTRKHVEQDLGYDVVANLGDQFSDLIGGYADRQRQAAEPDLLPALSGYTPGSSDPPHPRTRGRRITTAVVPSR